jgi:spermidine synthase
VLPALLGVSGAYLLAVGIDLVVGLVCVALAAVSTPRWLRAPVRAAPPGPAAALPSGVVWAVAAMSGAATLGAEVIWTRLFAQVLQNSARRRTRSC